MRTVTFGNGWPIVILSTSTSIFARVAEIAVSVGPYWFHTALHVLAKVFPRLKGRTSPPTTTCILASPCHPPSSKSRYIVGVRRSPSPPERRIGSILGPLPLPNSFQPDKH